MHLTGRMTCIAELMLVLWRLCMVIWLNRRCRLQDPHKSNRVEPCGTPKRTNTNTDVSDGNWFPSSWSTHPGRRKSFNRFTEKSDEQDARIWFVMWNAALTSRRGISVTCTWSASVVSLKSVIIRNITVSVLTVIICSQVAAFTWDSRCATCAVDLRVRGRPTRKSMPFAVPMIWRG